MATFWTEESARCRAVAERFGEVGYSIPVLLSLFVFFFTYHNQNLSTSFVNFYRTENGFLYQYTVRQTLNN